MKISLQPPTEQDGAPCVAVASPAVEEGFLPGLELVGAGRHCVRKLYELAAEGDLAQEEHEGSQPWGAEKEEEEVKDCTTTTATITTGWKHLHHPHPCGDVQRVYGDTVPDPWDGAGCMIVTTVK